ncbi:M18 family aminopeptidase [Clostridium sp. DL1XJH146]
MTKSLEFANELIDFIYESPTAFHAVESTKKILKVAGFSEITPMETWNLKKGGKYFTTKNDSAIIAFVVGNGELNENGFKIVGAHTDTPCFRIKPNSEMITGGSYLKLNTEVYGGPILNTWFDRPLSIAGRITTISDDIFNPDVNLININKPIMIIPNLAIHMNREVNNGIKLNPQEDTLPIIGLVNEELEKNDLILNLIKDELNIEKEEILDFDLFLYEFEKGKIVGLNNEFISSGRLDDLESAHSAIEAIKDLKEVNATNVLVLFDNEEIGSSTKQGADSNMLSDTLERIVFSLGGNREDFFRALSRSFMISADSAHAVHPNRKEKCDPTNKPEINKGPAIKISANQKYTSASFSSAVFSSICEKAGVPMQKFVNRSDERGGSTIGPINSTHLGINSVDIGIPLLAMHSIRELCGVEDHYYLYKCFREFYKK